MLMFLFLYGNHAAYDKMTEFIEWLNERNGKETHKQKAKEEEEKCDKWHQSASN